MNVAQQSIVLVVCLLYIAFISLLNFCITAVAILVAVGIYYLHTRKLIHEINAQKSAESRMLTTLEDVVDGFKEVRLNSCRSEAIHGKLGDITSTLYLARVRTNMHYCTEMMFSDVFFYMLLATIVFILPQYQHSMISEVLMSAAAILFIIGPLQSIVASSPVFLRAAVAIEHLEAFEHELDSAAEESDNSHPDQHVFTGPINSICLRDVTFEYPARTNENGIPVDPFQVGPFSLEITEGQTVFLVGGNGCGKTTLLKVLTGLYLPTSGQVLVNGQAITRDNLTSYRDNIAAIFSDFHLFDQLYGYENVDPARVNALLQLMELDAKTAFHHGRFTTQKLSTGQRKRLAMITALLEERDILIFDEWAADQDPHFRAYFYEQLLPDLKAQGKTIIAVTHDERYWSLADRVIRLEYGVLAEPILQ
ncbi:MAG TPA: cyclic peptide export ABC transporter [Armatimonadota bacterium]|nr:cyclic peptide export ABC transporter [Armatimonadota bacterium]